MRRLFSSKIPSYKDTIDTGDIYMQYPVHLIQTGQLEFIEWSTFQRQIGLATNEESM